MRSCRLPVLVSLLALVAAPARSQNSPQAEPHRRSVFSIGGNVRDDVNHRALENILVSLKLLTGPIANTVYTHSNGDFQFDGLSSGDYVLEIAATDYDTYRETVTLSDGSRLGM